MLHTSLLLVASLVALAAAQGSPQCTGGETVCCKKAQDAYAIPDLLSAAGVSVTAAANLGLVGSACTALTVIGDGVACATSQIPLCCTHHDKGAPVSLGCTHITPVLVSLS